MTPASILPTPGEVREASSRIAGSVLRTPLLHSAELSAVVGGEVYLKLECLQHGGSFKLRGALNALLTLPPEARSRGVVASSAGNHGIGVAIAAAQLGIEATIFVPATAPATKREKIAAHGARVIATEPNYDAADRAAREFASTGGATFVSPCTGRALLAGAGTVALEILEDLPTVATVVVPVGGGGLVGGIGGFIRGTANGVRTLGAQSVNTNAMTLALASGRPTVIPDLPTLCDGLAGLVDAEMLAQGKAALDGMATVEEADVARAIAWLHRENALRVEGSGAVGIAALIARVLQMKAFPVTVIVTGGNIDDTTLNGLTFA